MHTNRPGRRGRGQEAVLLVASLVGLIGGGLAWVSGHRQVADLIWGATTGVALVPALAWVVGGLRRRKLGVDLIAVLALAGTIVVAEYFAGAVIAVMLATGRALEARAT